MQHDSNNRNLKNNFEDFNENCLGLVKKIFNAKVSVEEG